MIHITNRIYTEMAEALTDVINGQSYWNGRISAHEWKFKGSVIIYWNTNRLGSGELETRMARLIWINWAVDFYDDRGGYAITDFSIDKLNEFLGISI